MKTIQKKQIIILSIVGVAIAVAIAVAFFFVLPNFAGKPQEYRVKTELINPFFSFDSEEWSNSLLIEFSQAVIKIDELTTTVDTSKIKLYPHIDGTWSWIGQDALLFEPKTPWEFNKNYSVQFESGFFNKNIKLDKTRFTFMTPKLELSVAEFGFVVDAADETKKYISAAIESNFKVPVTELAELIKISVTTADREDSFYGHNKEIAFTLSFDEYGQLYRLVSKPLPVPYGTTGFKCAAVGKLLNTSIKLENTVQIEGVTTAARIVGAEIANIENNDGVFEQTLIIESSVLIRSSDIENFLTVKVIDHNDSRLKTMSEAEVFAQTEAILLKPAKTTVPVNTLNGFVFNAEPGKKLRLEVKQGANVYGGYVINKPYSATITVPSFKNAVRFQGTGTILSSAGEKKLSAYAVGYNSLFIEVSRIQDEQVHHLISQTRGDFINLDFSNYSFSEKNISTVYSEEISLAPSESYGTPSYFSIDLDRYLNVSKTQTPKKGLFAISVYNTKNDLYPIAKKFVMISDIGMIQKRNSDGSSDIFVQSFATGKPVANVSIEVIGLNGVSLLKKTSDKNGQVTIPNTGDFKKEKRPILITAQNVSDFSVMKLNIESNRLSFSNFNVGGRDETHKDTAFIFTDRGIYRPGETVSFGIVIKSRNWDRSITGNVYECYISGAQGNVEGSVEWRPQPEGLESVLYEIPVSSRTGEWTIDVYRKLSNGSEFLASKNFRVDEFLPDTLRAEVFIDGVTSKQLWLPLEKLQGRVLVNQLNGFAASGNAVKTDLRLQNSTIAVPKFANYTFMTPLLDSRLMGAANSVAEETNSEGVAAFSFDLKAYEGSTYRLILDTVIFEKGSGRSIHRMNVLMVSPREFLIGSENGEKFFLKNTQAVIPFVAVNNEGSKTPVQGLRYQLLEKKLNTQLVKASGGLYEYKAIPQTVEIETIDAPFSSGEYAYRVDTKRGGDFVLNIIDAENTVLATSLFTVEGGANLAVSRGKISDLNLTLITANAVPEKEVVFFMKAPFTGSALITIERDRVYAAKWVTVSERNAQYSITLPAGIDGNAFINVILLRDYKSPDVYTSPVSIGALNVTIDRKARTNTVEVRTVHEILPGSTLDITYRSAEKSKIILYGVDEGILLFSRYKTPDPLSKFFEQKRLQVNTFQNLDLFLPEFSALRKKSADIGGDFESALAAGLNPFSRQAKKAVAFWSGVIESSNEARTYKYEIPDHFNGTLKIFAVAVSTDKIGVTETSTIVRDKIIVVPTIPLKAAPNDEINARVRVINNTGNADTFTLKLAMPSGITLLKHDELTFELDKEKEHTVNFSFKPSNSYGAVDLMCTVTAKKSGIIKTSRENISIRPSVPYIKELHEEKIASGKSKTFTNARKLQNELAKMTLELSYDPFGIMQTRLEFLENYSYACSEQLISRVLPKVLLANNERFKLDKKDTQQELTEIFRQLGIRMNTSGLLGVWRADSYGLSFLDTYLATLINAAHEQKFSVPVALERQNKDALTEFISMDDITDENEIRRQCQAVFLLTERGENTSSHIERLNTKIKRRNLNWKNDIASAYLASALKLLKADEQADALMGDVSKKLTVAKASSFYENTYVYNAQLLRMLSKYFAGERYDAAIKRLINTVLEDSSSTTVNASFMIAALSETVKTFAEVPREITVEITDSEGKKSSQKITLGAEVLRLPLDLKTASVKIDNPNQTLPLFAVFNSAGYDETRAMPSDNQGLEIVRIITDKAGNKVTSANVGDELIVLLRLQAAKGDVYNLVLIDSLPACFEHDLSKPVSETDSSGAFSLFADKREDRILVFTDAPKGRMIEFRYPVKVTTAGIYALPPLFSENLYVNNSLTLTQSETFMVSQ